MCRRSLVVIHYLTGEFTVADSTCRGASPDRGESFERARYVTGRDQLFLRKRRARCSVTNRIAVSTDSREIPPGYAVTGLTRSAAGTFDVCVRVANNNNDRHYRSDIDGLRAIAILGVVAYHVGIPGITGGFAGVDVFFVISGYLITQLLARELAASGSVSLANFYARRMRRILPALVVVVLASVAASCVLQPIAERQELARSALAAMAFVANYFFMSLSGGYFDGAAELKPLLHLWSLSVEEQFYVVWPLLLLAISRAAHRQVHRRRMRYAIGAIVIGSFAWSAWLVDHDLPATFFSAPARAWELGIGALLALGPEPGSDRPKLRRIAAAGGALLVLAAFTLLQSATRFPGPAALPAVLGAALLIWGNGRPSTTLLYRSLTSRPMVAIGLTSYGWYLWHWPILSLLRGATLMRAGVGSAFIAALLAYVLAALSLKYIEMPWRRGAFVRGTPPTTVLRWGVACMAAIAVVASGTWAWATYGPRSAREQLAARVDGDKPADANYDCLLQPDTWTGTLPLEECRFGAAGEVDLVLWGDSHAMALAPIVLAMQHSGTSAFLQLTMGNCLPLRAADDRIGGAEQPLLPFQPPGAVRACDPQGAGSQRRGSGWQVEQAVECAPVSLRQAAAAAGCSRPVHGALAGERGVAHSSGRPAGSEPAYHVRRPASGRAQGARLAGPAGTATATAGLCLLRVSGPIPLQHQPRGIRRSGRADCRHRSECGRRISFRAGP